MRAYGALVAQFFSDFLKPIYLSPGQAVPLSVAQDGGMWARVYEQLVDPTTLTPSANPVKNYNPLLADMSQRLIVNSEHLEPTGHTGANQNFSGATTPSQVVLAQSGYVEGIQITNATATAFYFKQANISSAPIIGTTGSIVTFICPPMAVTTIIGPRYFSTGFAWWITGAFLSSDATVIAAGFGSVLTLTHGDF